MITSQDPTIPLNGITVSSHGKVEEKLRRFKAAGKDNTYYLFDFDRTLTSSSHLFEDVTLWNLIDDLLPADSRHSYDKLSKEYQRREHAGELSEEDAKAWWALSFELYIQHGMNLNEVKHVIDKLHIRAGAVDLFNLCESHDVPTIILSAGIGDVIELLTREHHMHPTTILSTKLQLDEDGRITGWDPESVVHVLNKHDKGQSTLSEMHKKRPFTVLIGDSLGDAEMVKGDDNVLRIRVGDRRKEHLDNWQDYLDKSFAAGFDMVVDSESLEPVVAITKWLCD